MKKLSRIAVGLGGVVLILTGAYHGLGSGGVHGMLTKSSVDSEWAFALAGVWLFASWHWLVIALPLLWFAFSNRASHRRWINYCGAVVLLDFIWVLVLAGVFVGTGLLLAASILILGGANLPSGQQMSRQELS